MDGQTDSWHAKSSIHSIHTKYKCIDVPMDGPMEFKVHLYMTVYILYMV